MPCQIHCSDCRVPNSPNPSVSYPRSEFTAVLFVLAGMSGFLVSVARLLVCFPEDARHGSCSWNLEARLRLVLAFGSQVEVSDENFRFHSDCVRFLLLSRFTRRWSARSAPSCCGCCSWSCRPPPGSWAASLPAQLSSRRTTIRNRRRHGAGRRQPPHIANFTSRRLRSRRSSGRRRRFRTLLLLPLRMGTPRPPASGGEPVRRCPERMKKLWCHRALTRVPRWRWLIHILCQRHH